MAILPELLEGNKLDTVSDGECKMLQISDTGKTVVNQEQLDLFWLGTVAVYSPWMDYLGKYGFFAWSCNIVSFLHEVLTSVNVLQMDF